jgi:hypothetical protein
MLKLIEETRNKSFDRLGTNGKELIPFVVSSSNHEWNQLTQNPLRLLTLAKTRFLFFAQQ